MRNLPLLVCFRFLPLVAGCVFGARLPAGVAFAIILAVGGVMAALGAMVLRTAPLGAITWRNVVASWLLPWCHVAGGGGLVRLVIASLAVWAALALAGVLGWQHPWLLAAWLLDGIALRYLAGPSWQRGSDRLHRRMGARITLVILGLAGAGLVAMLLGQPLLGAAIAGGPPAAIGIVYGLFVGMFVVLKPRHQ
jgi:hypothetical protein